MSDEAVTCLIEGPVATITLNRPESKNRLDAAAMQIMVEHLQATAQDDAVRVVVITGSGSTYCSGADLAGAVAAA